MGVDPWIGCEGNRIISLGLRDYLNENGFFHLEYISSGDSSGGVCNIGYQQEIWD